MARGAPTAEPTERLVKAALAAKDELAKHRSDMAILFADLCDSTSYKLNRGNIEGIIKTYRHNLIVGDEVHKHNGVVVKYIGDEVMATFAGADAAYDAIQTAINIQKAISILNPNIEGPNDEKIVSKIGIHCGEVILAKFEGHDALDPQGKAVDAAARIISLCNAGQILCSEEIKTKIGNRATFSDEYKREVKGIRDGVKIYEVLYEELTPRPAKRNNHVDVSNPEVTRLFQAAVEEESIGKIEVAASRYEMVLAADPMHFGANFRLARIGYKYRKEVRLDASYVGMLTERAEESRADSGAAKAQSVVAAYTRGLGGKLSASGEPISQEEFEEELITKAREAIDLARSSCDRLGEIVAMNALACLLVSKYKRTQGNDLYREADRVSRITENMIDDFNKKLVPAFYETYAQVLMIDRFNRSSLLKAKELAEKSSQLRETPHAYATLSDVMKLLDGD